MKKFAVLVLALTMVFGTVVKASAATDVRLGGLFEFAFFLNDDTGQPGMHKDTKNDFIARERVRTWVDFIVSESLKGQLFFEIGESNWGNLGEHDAAGQGFSIGGDGVSIEVRRAFIDWIVPSTQLKVRMGLQGIAMPMALGKNVVFDDDMAGIFLSYKFNDMVSANLFWSRPYDGTFSDGFQAGISESDNFDAFGLIIPISVSGVNVTPWAAYANIGSQIPVGIPSGAGSGVAPDSRTAGRFVGKGLRLDPAGYGKYDYAWWAGLALTVTALDPFVIKLDAIYGQLHNDLNDDKYGTAGWWLGGSFDYKASWGTPGLFAWYASGDDENERGQIAQLSSPGNSLLSLAFDDTWATVGGGGKQLNAAGVGLWGVGLYIKDLSFIQGMKHVIRIAYIQGTNDKDSTVGGIGFGPKYMSTKDNAFEIDFNTAYSIYSNLTAYLELGYLIPNFSNYHKTAGGQGLGDYYDQNAFKCVIGLAYSF